MTADGSLTKPSGAGEATLATRLAEKISAFRVEDITERALTEARTAGEPEDCVQINRIRNTRVRDERTIDFFMNGGKVMRNTLPYECPGLAFEDRFAFETSLSRLCSVDTITVLQSGVGRGASCGLGSFQPVELPER